MLTLELMLGLPILLIVILAVVEFGLLLMSAQAVSAAASVGAREASLPGATAADVNAAVRQALRPWRFGRAIDPVVVDPPQPALAKTGDLVSVTVSVDSVAAAPNLLKMFGVSLAGQKLSTTYVYRKE